jgi:subfamily B ATP-binding cassette protein HlyB/CyaB
MRALESSISRFVPAGGGTSPIDGTLPLDRDTFLWVLHSLCALCRVPFDATLLEQRFPPPYSPATLKEAAAALGFVATEIAQMPERLGAADLPVFAFLPTGAEAKGGRDESPGLAAGLIARIEGADALVLRQGSDVAERLPRVAIRSAARGPLLAFERAPERLPDAEEGLPAPVGTSTRRDRFGLGWFGREMLRHKRVWGDVLTASAVIQVLGLLTPLCTQVIIDKVVVHQTASTLLVVAVALGVFVVFGAAMTWIRQYLVIHTGNRIDAVLGAEVFSHLMRLPLGFFERRPTGVLVARLAGIETVREFVTGATVTLLLDLPFMLLCLGLMLWYSWQLSLIALTALVGLVVLGAVVTPRLRARLNEQFLLGARNQAFVTEHLAAMETVKSLQLEWRLEQRYGDYLAAYLAAAFRTRAVANGYHVIAGALEQFMMLGILCVGAWLVMSNAGMTIGMLVAFQMFAGRLSQPLLRLVGLWQEFQQAAIAVRRLGDVMNAPAEPHSLLPGRMRAGQGRIEIRGLGFRHADNLPWLYRNLELTVEPGECVALLGPSGSGKSTLAKLLQGFHLATEGTIRLDGHDVRHLAANELRAGFGVVPQEAVLFSGTLYDNLSVAHPNACFEDVVEACRRAGIHAFIESLPLGYQTPVGEHGAGLSGGQKQRIAIARALLKRPKVLVFDEATSHLDTQTEADLVATLQRLRGRVTTLFITHRIPAGMTVDRVLQLGPVSGQRTG